LIRSIAVIISPPFEAREGRDPALDLPGLARVDRP